MSKFVSIQALVVLCAAVLMAVVLFAQGAAAHALQVPAAAAAAASKVKDTPSTVPTLNVTEYLGLWYQVYSDDFNKLFEPNPYCATAFYGLFPNNTISVRNIDRDGGYNGTRSEVEGYAYQVSPTEFPGRLSVVFPFNPVPGPYWILRLGAASNGQYRYSIVSDSLRLSLFVLARNVTEYYANYNDEVQQFLAQQGYTNALNTPKQVPQGAQCNYN